MKKGIKSLLGAVVSVSVFLFLLVGVFENSAARKSVPMVRTPSAERVGTLRFSGKGTLRFHRDMDMFYVSKRKVPNGPDPIHNRRAQTSRRPPGV